MGIQLYVANYTKHRSEFIFLLPEAPAPHTQSIDAGHQILVHGELTQLDVDAIIAQHARYGMINIIERPAEGFSGLCYSIGEAITGTPLQD